ncbi:magnesium/cobalt transporter CorA [Tellurirhabdus bombi]|uniref:magnesium/cobalt transporter CorA n=1 Tax=Tellurirhabdus bombi TaxID=2907205 RepID=UPI001F437775|nr:magnesium/cobalt transporter CorA [Tellurirhabdus bombi]
MSKNRYRHQSKKVGTSPGSLIYVGQEVEHETRVQRIEYSPEKYTIEEVKRLSNCTIPPVSSPQVNWLSVDGIHEPAVIERIGQQYKLHSLLLEDVVNTLQKPKLEQYDDHYLFTTLKALSFNNNSGELESEHLSFVLGPQYLISFQEERQSDLFKPVLDRIAASAGKTRRNGADYLLYALLDLVVDNYFVVLETVGERLEVLEDSIIQQVASQQTLARLYSLKRVLTLMRKVVWPVREIINGLLLEESPLLQPSTTPYLRDLYDHVVQVLDNIDSYRELATGLLDVYLSTLSNRMNSVMKTLTIISAIFIPLTFIAGIYGMNFEYMPELRSPYGYFATLGVMLLIAIGSIIYFRKRGWM